MWFLVGKSGQARSIVVPLKPNSKLLVGRVKCDIPVDEKSVSRTHFEIAVGGRRSLEDWRSGLGNGQIPADTKYTICDVTITDKKSSLGTMVDSVKLDPGVNFVAKDYRHTIQFARGQAFELIYYPIHVVVGTLHYMEIQQITQLLNELNITVSKSWDIGVTTHLIQASFDIKKATLNCLSDGGYLVKPAWVISLAGNLSKENDSELKYFKFGAAEDYESEVDTMKILRDKFIPREEDFASFTDESHDDVDLMPNPTRKTLFQSYHFLVFDPNEQSVLNLTNVVGASGGVVEIFPPIKQYESVQSFAEESTRSHLLHQIASHRFGNKLPPNHEYIMVKPMYKDPPETADDYLMKKLADILDEEKKNDIGVANADDIIQAILYADKTKVKPPLAGREVRAKPKHIEQISTEPKSDLSNILVPATPVVPGTQSESDKEVDNATQRNINDTLAIASEVKSAPRFSGLKKSKRPMRTGSIISVKSQTRDVVGFLDDLLESAPLPEYAIRDTQKTAKAQISAFDQSSQSQTSKFNSQTQRVNKSESQAFSLRDHLGLSATGPTGINASESADVDMEIGSPQVAKLHTPKRQKTFNVVETLLDSLDDPNISEQASFESSPSSEVKVFRPPGQSVTVPPSSSESTPLKSSISKPSGPIVHELKPKVEKKLSKMEQLKIQKQKENEINSLVEQEEYEEILKIKPEELKGVCQVEFADLVVNRRSGKNVENQEETSIATNRPQGMTGYANYFQQTLHLRDGKVIKDFRRFKKSPSKKLPRIIEVVPASQFSDINMVDSDDEVPRTKLKSKLKKESPDRQRSRQDHSQPEFDVDTYHHSPEKRIDDYNDDEFISKKDVKLKTVKDRNQLTMIVNNKVKVKTESSQPPSQVPSQRSQHTSQRQQQRKAIPLTSSSSQKQSKLNFTKLQPKLARRQLRSLESSSSSDNDDDEILNVDHEGIGLDQSTVSSTHSSNITQLQLQKQNQNQNQKQTLQHHHLDSQLPHSNSQTLNPSSHGPHYSLGKGIQSLRAKKEENRLKRRKLLSSDDDE